MGAQYRCNSCMDARTKDPADNRKFTFMAWIDECLKRTPGHLRYKFPAVLSARSGVDRDLARMLHGTTDKDLRPHALAEILLELHSLEYTDCHIMHELSISRTASEVHHFRKQKEKLELFSAFGNKGQYTGTVPSGE